MTLLPDTLALQSSRFEHSTYLTHRELEASFTIEFDVEKERNLGLRASAYAYAQCLCIR